MLFKHGLCASKRVVELNDLQDVVETHLLRDIAARSENFFQAASVVQDLRGVLARTYMQVKTLRQKVSTLQTPSCCCILCDAVYRPLQQLCLRSTMHYQG